MERVDILIAGAGIAGLAAAARLGADGHRVALVDPLPPGTAPDLRTTAYLQPSVETLTRAGAWAGLEAEGAPLRIMRLVDAGGRQHAVRETADFDAAPAGHRTFGWNVPNAAARAALLTRIADLPVTHLCEVSVTGYVGRDREALVRLSDGQQIAARLVIAADGRGSTLRRLAGLRHKAWDYGQQGLVFAVTHNRPHEGVSTEIHSTGGPCTLVPMPDRDGRPCSSVVWMMPGPRARDVAALDDAGLATALTAETLGLHGPLTVTGPRASWPIVTQAALGLVAQRLVLIAEAAHVVPPIGAQGLNMSLHDIETLATMIGDGDPGDPAMLRTYERRQMPRLWSRVLGIDALNRAAMAEAQPVRDLRLAGLRALSRLRPLRDLAVRAGMGG